MTNQKKPLNHEEFSRRGGKTTLAKYGKDHFKDIGKRGAKAKVKKYGPDYFQRISKAGVMARKAKRDSARKLEESKE